MREGGREGERGKEIRDSEEWSPVFECPCLNLTSRILGPFFKMVTLFPQASTFGTPANIYISPDTFLNTYQIVASRIF